MTDPYGWLRDDNWRAVMREPGLLKRDIREFLEGENKRVTAALEDTQELQKTLFEEMKGRIREDDKSVPAPDGRFEYYRRFETGQDYALHCRRPRRHTEAGGEEDEEILLDENARAEAQAYLKIGMVSHAPGHRYVAWSEDTRGSEYFDILIRDTETGEVLDDRITGASGGFAWAAEARHLLWTELDDNHRPYKIWLHQLGRADDSLIYTEQDPGFFLSVGKTESGKFIILNAHDHTTSEIRLIPASEPERAPLLIARRETDIEYEVADLGDRLMIHTNAGGAEDFAIMTAPLAEPGRDRWAELVAHRPGCLIEDMLVFSGYLVRLERDNALPRIVIREMASGEEHMIAFDEEAYDLGLAPGFEFDTTTLRFTYSSMTTPRSVYDYDMATRERACRKVQEVPSGHRPADYVSRRIMARAHDGEQIPVSLLYRADLDLAAAPPCLLYGYGAYGISIPASFSTNRLSLVDRGFVYAIAHIRGGKEKGYGWYKAGKLETKTNTFRDFISVAETLIAQGYALKEGIAAHGGSAGGMLMGAIANMRPDLFGAIVADVPFVDVLATMLDKDLPLTPPEWPEWGNPIEDKAAYETIAGYSPVDNVSAQAYPHILATAGLADPRVTYWEPAKWVSKLRDERTNDNLLLLKTNMEAGHGGKSGRFEYLHEVALMYGFILKAIVH